MVRVDLIHSSPNIDLKPDNWLQYLAIEFIFLRKNYTYVFIVIQESWLENLGTKSSKVRDGGSWESIKEFQVGRSDWVRSRCQAKHTGHPCFWILSTRTSPSTKVPARGEFWFRPPFGVSWSLCVCFLRLCEPLDQSDPTWSGGPWCSVRRPAVINPSASCGQRWQRHQIPAGPGGLGGEIGHGLRPGPGA